MRYNPKNPDRATSTNRILGFVGALLGTIRLDMWFEAWWGFF